MSLQQFLNTTPRLGKVRILTLNLWTRNGAWDARRAVLIDGLRALQPDLVAFQEVIKNDMYDQMMDLLGSGWNIAHQQGHDVCASNSPKHAEREAHMNLPWMLIPKQWVRQVFLQRVERASVRRCPAKETMAQRQ